MTRRAFASCSSVLTVAMIAFIIAFPLFIVALGRASHCGPDTCGAIGLVYGMFGRMIGVLIYGTAMLAVIFARCDGKRYHQFDWGGFGGVNVALTYDETDTPPTTLRECRSVDHFIGHYYYCVW